MVPATGFVKALQQRQYAVNLLVAVSLRVGVFAFTSLPQILEKRPELTTPLTSFRSLREGVFIYEKGTNPYNGGVFYHSPIYLAVFSYIIPVSSYVITTLFWTLADIVGSLALVRIWMTRKGRPGVSKEKEDRRALVSALYLFNPYTLLSCLARTTTSIDNTLLLSAISSAASGQAVAACTLLSLAAHTSLYPALLLPSILMLLFSNSSPRPQLPRDYSLLFVLIGAFVLPALINWTFVGWAWIPQTWGVVVSVSDLAPNVGMWWYFFTEMFDHFRIFFLGVFQLHIAIYVVPVCVRFRHDPLLAILVLLGAFGTWKSYPTLGDAAVWAGLLGCCPEVIANLRHPLFTLTVHLYTAILLPLLHTLWLLTGTGNANFFYAATMVYGLSGSLTVVDIMAAGLRSNIKRLVAEQLGGKVAKEESRWDWNAIEKQWEEYRWAVVQFTGTEKQ